MLLGFGGVLGLGSGCGTGRAHRSRTVEPEADPIAVPDRDAPVRVMYGVRPTPYDRDRLAVRREISVVSGTVTDGDSGRALAGVVVMPLPDGGAENSVVSDSDGRYTIRAAVGDSLGFYYLGYVTQTVKVADVELDVRLRVDSVALTTPIMVMYGVRPVPFEPGKEMRERVVVGRVVTGRITYAESGEAIQGVLVDVVSEAEGTFAISDPEGRYSIDVGMADSLRFSYLGTITQTRKVKGDTLDVRMEADSLYLKEVIRVAYGSPPADYDPHKFIREADEKRFTSPAIIE